MIWTTLALLIACGQDAPTTAAPTSAAPTTAAPTTAIVQQQAPDWEAAIDMSAARTDAGARVTLVVKDGFHVYGSDEKTSRPLRIEVTGHPDAVAQIPGGSPKAVAGLPEPAYVLTGTIDLDVSVSEVPDAIDGKLHYQVCTKTVCSMPTARPWSVAAATAPAEQ